MRVAFSASPLYLHRLQHLFKTLAARFPDNERVSGIGFGKVQRAAFRFRSECWTRGWHKALSVVELFVPLTPWDARVYRARSSDAERKILALPKRPDLIFHLFGMYAPVWRGHSIPYVMALDFTEEIARREWAPWAPFLNDKAWKAWWECERRAYNSATHLFPFGQRTRDSLIEDYGVAPEKITVVGSGGHFDEFYEGAHSFGSKRILFYGDPADFGRKGGDLVTAAFEFVRQRIPDAKLAVVGGANIPHAAGVEEHGWVSREKMRELFLTSDLVVAPSRCDPFPTFLIEAMNFGVPCVTSDVDGMPEIVENEVTGLVLSDFSGERLGAEVTRLLNDTGRLASMSEQSRRKVREKLNWHTIGNAIADKIEALALLPASEPNADKPPYRRVALSSSEAS